MRKQATFLGRRCGSTMPVLPGLPGLLILGGVT
jgi:hypothetical protein